MPILTPDLLQAPDAERAVLARWQEVRARNLLLGMRRRWRLVAMMFLLALVGASVALLFVTPLYTASVVVQVDPHDTKYINFNNVTGQGGSLTDAPGVAIVMRTESDLFKAAAGDAVTALDLTHDSEFNKPLLAERVGWALDSARDAIASISDYLTVALPQAHTVDKEQAEPTIVVKRVLRNLDIEADGRSKLFTASFSASTPEKAMRIINEFARKYLERQMTAKVDITARATDWVREQLAEAQQRLGRAEAAVENFRKQNLVTEVSPNSESIVGRQLSEANLQLAAAAAALGLAEARYGGAKAQVAAGQTDSIPEVLSSPVIQKLREEQSRVAGTREELASQYGENHPITIRATWHLREIQARIRDEVARVVAGLANAVEVSRADESQLKQRVQVLRATVSASDTTSFQLRALEREAESNRDFVKTMALRYEELNALQNGQAADARIMSAATLPAWPSSPNIPVVLTTTSVLALLLATAVVMWLEHLDKGFRLVGEVEAATDSPCLGILPDFSRLAVGRTGQNSPIFAEAVRTVRTAIDSFSLEKPHVLLVTSSVPEEGKSVFAHAIARALASSGRRTLLIDGDLRCPTIWRLLECPGRDFHAVVNLQEMAVPSIVPNLDVIAPARGTAGAQELLGSRAMDQFIETMRKMYDAIVIDSPPVLLVADACVMARFADSVLYAVRWGKTNRHTVALGVKRLRDMSRTKLATVLTRVDFVRQSRYSPSGEAYLTLAHGARYYGDRSGA
jgi:polysaccharide biosynthesis transport protein